MKLGLVQTRHNAMYNFLSPAFPYSEPDCRRMQREQVTQNLNLLAEAAGQGYDLLITTECINYIRTSCTNVSADAVLYPALDRQTLEPLATAARQAKSWLVAGLGFRQGEQAYNGALVFDRTGSLRAVYNKMHLAGDEGQVFVPGCAPCVVEADFGIFGVCICWDLQFPETARLLTLGGAQLLICPTWGWEADLYGRARAYENGVFVAAAMAVPAWGPIAAPRTPSSVIDPFGNLLACGPADAPCLLSCTLDLAVADQPRQQRLAGRRPELYASLAAVGGPGGTAPPRAEGRFARCNTPTYPEGIPHD